MHSITHNTVVLNDREMLAKELFDHFLDRGESVPRAATRTVACYPGLSDEFVAYLRNELPAASLPSQADLVRASLLRCPGPIASAQALQRRLIDGPRIVR